MSTFVPLTAEEFEQANRFPIIIPPTGLREPLAIQWLKNEGNYLVIDGRRVIVDFLPAAAEDDSCESACTGGARVNCSN